MGYQLRRLVAWHGRAKGWARVLVNEIADMVRDEDPTGPAWPGIARLTRMMGCDSRTVRRAIQDAVKAGDINCVAKVGAPNRYTLTPELLSLCQGGQPDSTVTVSPHPGQPDRGVLSESQGGTVTVSPEPQLNHKRTTTQPQVDAGDETETDVGPIPFSDPDPFTKAARAAGIGSQTSKRAKVAKQRAAEKFDLGELENAPAIRVHRDVCGVRPLTREQAEQIVASVNGDAETMWRDNLTFWMAKEYHADSIDRQLDRLETERKRARAKAAMPDQGAPAERHNPYALPDTFDAVRREIARRAALRGETV